MRTMQTFPHRTARVGLAFAALVGAVLACAGCPSEGIPTYDPCPGGVCGKNTDTCVEIVYPGTAGEGVGRMCTEQGCHGDAECPTDVRGVHGACLSFDAALSTCFERCTRLGDCALGWSCQRLAPTAGTEVDVCVPDPA